MDAAVASDRLKPRVGAAADATLDWLRTMAEPTAPAGVLRFSAAHDPVRWPGVLLPGTYNGVHCLALLGGLDRLSGAERAALVGWLERHRRGDGIFAVPGMTDDTVFKKTDKQETWAYIDYHVTNYALGAVEMLAPDRRPELGFVAPLTEPSALRAWLAGRDWDDPWLEGNNLVNLASFLLLRASDPAAEVRARADRAIDALFAHLEASQNPRTGFWGNGQEDDPTRRLHAMAGAMHIFHLWYAMGRSLPHHRTAIDYVLGLDPAENMGACLDVDCVDVLVNGVRLTGHRADDVDRWLDAKLDLLLGIQNPDGGFADTAAGTLRLDGWVGGYSEPQGVSNTFATWFRWIAIAMIAERFWPDWRRWQFRRMIGIGYRWPGPAASGNT